MILDFIKDIFSSPDSSFKKLTPAYFFQQKMKFGTMEKYAKWLTKQEVKHFVMAQMEKEKGHPLPQLWIDGLRLISDEKEKIGIQVKASPLPVAKYNPMQIIIMIIVILIFMVDFGFRALKLFSNMISGEDRAYVESVVPVNLSSAAYLENISATRDYLEKRKYDEMLKSAQEALLSAKMNREKTEAHYWIGLSFFKLKNIINAETQYNTAISIDPNYVPAYSSLSAVYYEYGNYEQAVDFAKKAISLDPDYSWAHSNMAFAYYKMGKTVEAIEEFEIAIALSPDVPDFYSNLASAYNDQGETEKAEEIYQKGMGRVPNSMMLHFGLAMVYAKANKLDDFDREMKLAVEYDKYYPETYMSLFEYYAYSNKTDELKNLLIKYLDATGISKEVLRNEINTRDWIMNKNKIFKTIDELP